MFGRPGAEYRTANGLVRSHWRYEGENWIWSFTVPPGSTADVLVPGSKTPKSYGPGDYTISTILYGMNATRGPNRPEP